MVLGSPFYLFVLPRAALGLYLSETNAISGFFTELTLDLSLEPGVLVSFLICYLALSINDFGSIQSMGELLEPADMGRRLRRGMTLTGLANIAAGLFGVIGPVNFSFSPGIVLSTGCASRLVLLPAAAIVGLLAFSPMAVCVMGGVPSVVIGGILLYTLTAQVAGGLIVAFQEAEEERIQFDTALIIGLPLLLGTIVAFLPPDVLDTFPAVLKPILGNGFVVGVLSTLLLEHLILRQPVSQVNSN
jgi:xanthine/uracil permease